MEHTRRHGGLLRDILQIRIFRPNNGDMTCETFREVKELAWYRTEWDGWLCQTSLRTVINDDDEIFKIFVTIFNEDVSFLHSP